ncbi:hypothetical protein [Streptomyces erythrochromogenes]|uniref:hypothetical protein n=1 Tax=Streptomyces erythrochromogenes TaxID=285574 RepID=UPI0033D3527A
MVVEVGYARAWDPEAREARRPMSAGEARERDDSGLPYVVGYRTAGRDAPLEVRPVSWRDHFAGVRVYDRQGRTHDVDMRLPAAQAHGLSEPQVLVAAEAADSAEAAEGVEGFDGGRENAPATCRRPPRPAGPGPIGELFRPALLPERDEATADV